MEIEGECIDTDDEEGQRTLTPPSLITSYVINYLAKVT